MLRKSVMALGLFGLAISLSGCICCMIDGGFAPKRSITAKDLSVKYGASQSATIAAPMPPRERVKS